MPVVSRANSAKTSCRTVRERTTAPETVQLAGNWLILHLKRLNLPSGEIAGIIRDPRKLSQATKQAFDPHSAIPIAYSEPPRVVRPLTLECISILDEAINDLEDLSGIPISTALNLLDSKLDHRIKEPALRAMLARNYPFHRLSITCGKLRLRRDVLNRIIFARQAKSAVTEAS